MLGWSNTPPPPTPNWLKPASATSYVDLTKASEERAAVVKQLNDERTAAREKAYNERYAARKEADRISNEGWERARAEGNAWRDEQWRLIDEQKSKERAEVLAQYPDVDLNAPRTKYPSDRLSELGGKLDAIFFKYEPQYGPIHDEMQNRIRAGYSAADAAAASIRAPAEARYKEIDDYYNFSNPTSPWSIKREEANNIYNNAFANNEALRTSRTSAAQQYKDLKALSEKPTNSWTADDLAKLGIKITDPSQLSSARSGLGTHLSFLIKGIEYVNDPETNSTSPSFTGFGADRINQSAKAIAEKVQEFGGDINAMPISDLVQVSLGNSQLRTNNQSFTPVQNTLPISSYASPQETSDIPSGPLEPAKITPFEELDLKPIEVAQAPELTREYLLSKQTMLMPRDEAEAEARRVIDKYGIEKMIDPDTGGDMDPVQYLADWGQTNGFNVIENQARGILYAAGSDPDALASSRANRISTEQATKIVDDLLKTNNLTFDNPELRDQWVDYFSKGGVEAGVAEFNKAFTSEFKGAVAGLDPKYSQGQLVTYDTAKELADALFEAGGFQKTGFYDDGSSAEEVYRSWINGSQYRPIEETIALWNSRNPNVDLSGLTDSLRIKESERQELIRQDNLKQLNAEIDFILSGGTQQQPFQPEVPQIPFQPEVPQVPVGPQTPGTPQTPSEPFYPDLNAFQPQQPGFQPELGFQPGFQRPASRPLITEAQRPTLDQTIQFIDSGGFFTPAGVQPMQSLSPYDLGNTFQQQLQPGLSSLLVPAQPPALAPGVSTIGVGRPAPAPFLAPTETPVVSPQDADIGEGVPAQMRVGGVVGYQEGGMPQYSPEEAGSTFDVSEYIDPQTGRFYVNEFQRDVVFNPELREAERMARERMTPEQEAFDLEQMRGRFGLPGSVRRVRPYAEGGDVKGVKAAAQQLASMGRNGDTMLAHINPQEAGILKALGGSGTINPKTGLREYFTGLEAAFFAGLMGISTVATIAEQRKQRKMVEAAQNEARQERIQQIARGREAYDRSGLQDIPLDSSPIRTPDVKDEKFDPAMGGIRIGEGVPEIPIPESSGVAALQPPPTAMISDDERRRRGMMANGGVIALAGGGMTYMEAGGTTGPTGMPRDVTGTGDGMSDSVPATIEGVQEARLADGEFVIPADVVADIGNGSSDAGSKKLYTMMDRIRKARHGTTEQPPEINAEAFMPV